MHIQPVVQTFTVTLTRKEIQLIAYGLGLHAANPGTVDEKIQQCRKMQESFNNALTPSHKGKLVAIAQECVEKAV
jgi:hypothetical protein